MLLYVLDVAFSQAGLGGMARTGWSAASPKIKPTLSEKE
jgi:hypothetical protein